MNRFFLVIGILALFAFANVGCDKCEKTDLDILGTEEVGPDDKDVKKEPADPVKMGE